MATTQRVMSAQVALPAVQLFSGRAIGWLTLCCGVPTGLVLLAHNWWQLGQRARTARYFVAALLAALALVAIVFGALGKQGPWFLLLANVLAVAILPQQVEGGEAAARRGGQLLAYRNAWFGLGIGAGVILALVAGSALVLATLADEPRLIALGEGDGHAQWVAALGGLGDGAPVVTTATGGRVFVAVAPPGEQAGQFRDEVIGFDAASGRQLWRVVPDRRRANSARGGGSFRQRKLFADADTVYVQVWSGNDFLDLYALDAASGAPRWSTKLLSHGPPSGAYAQVARRGDALVVLEETLGNRTTPNRSFALRALDRRTGKQTWRVALADADPQTVPEGPYAADEAIVVGLGAGRAAAFAPDTGERRWTIAGAPTLLGMVGTTLYGQAAAPVAGSRENVQDVIALDPATGQRGWSFRYTRQAAGVVFFDQGGTYVQVRQQDAANPCVEALVALAADGGERWRATDPVIGLFPPVLGRETIVVHGRPQSCSGGGREPYLLAAYARSDGAERWRWPIDQLDGLATDDGRVFILDEAPRWRNWLARFNPTWP